MNAKEAAVLLSARIAIEGVLRAERDAATTIEAARSEARERIARATAAAQVIANRGEARLKNIHAICSRAQQEALRQLSLEQIAAARRLAQHTLSQSDIEQAAARVAAHLTAPSK